MKQTLYRVLNKSPKDRAALWHTLALMTSTAIPLTGAAPPDSKYSQGTGGIECPVLMNNES
ncbi:hypothetical protein TIFTF001_020651 [Ficus carica]|uniref:Uncharacterized protein n=1 Tax=Ficus carica TaxID=3494 RepID=A0AA88DJM8_FICCA|nr:hypothetical protein TIFTF001_020651 [Ficus carica]